MHELKSQYERGDQMNKEELLNKVARLESLNDYLETEICDLDRLMKMVGFKYGLNTVKATAKELIERGLVESTDID